MSTNKPSIGLAVPEIASWIVRNYSEIATFLDKLNPACKAIKFAE